MSESTQTPEDQSKAPEDLITQLVARLDPDVLFDAAIAPLLERARAIDIRATRESLATTEALAVELFNPLNMRNFRCLFSLQSYLYFVEDYPRSPYSGTEDGGNLRQEQLQAIDACIKNTAIEILQTTSADVDNADASECLAAYVDAQMSRLRQALCDAYERDLPDDFALDYQRLKEPLVVAMERLAIDPAIEADDIALAKRLAGQRQQALDVFDENLSCLRAMLAEAPLPDNPQEVLRLMTGLLVRWACFEDIGPIHAVVMASAPDFQIFLPNDTARRALIHDVTLWFCEAERAASPTHAMAQFYWLTDNADVLGESHYWRVMVHTDRYIGFFGLDTWVFFHAFALNAAQASHDGRVGALFRFLSTRAEDQSEVEDLIHATGVCADESAAAIASPLLLSQWDYEMLNYVTGDQEIANTSIGETLRRTDYQAMDDVLDLTDLTYTRIESVSGLPPLPGHELSPAHSTC